MSIKWAPLPREIRNRIRVAVAAYAYEIESNPIMSDGQFDKLALRIRPRMKTGRRRLDWFFKNKFQAHTGQWIYDHPELEGIKYLYHKHYKGDK